MGVDVAPSTSHLSVCFPIDHPTPLVLLESWLLSMDQWHVVGHFKYTSSLCKVTSLMWDSWISYKISINKNLRTSCISLGYEFLCDQWYMVGHFN